MSETPGGAPPPSSGGPLPSSEGRFRRFLHRRSSSGRRRPSDHRIRAVAVVVIVVALVGLAVGFGFFSDDNGTDTAVSSTTTTEARSTTTEQASSTTEADETSTTTAPDDSTTTTEADETSTTTAPDDSTTTTEADDADPRGPPDSSTTTSTPEADPAEPVPSTSVPGSTEDDGIGGDASENTTPDGDDAAEPGNDDSDENGEETDNGSDADDDSDPEVTCQVITRQAKADSYQAQADYFATLAEGGDQAEANAAFEDAYVTILRDAAAAATEAQLNCWQPEDTDEPGEATGTQVHFYAYDTPNVNFGPAAPESNAEAAYAELLRRIGAGDEAGDPNLTVTTAEALQILPPLNPDQRQQLARELIDVPEKWQQLREQIQHDVSVKRDAGQHYGLDQVCGPYVTMYQTDEADGFPRVYNDEVDVPCFTVLRIGEARFKLSCGFQPVWLEPTTPRVNRPGQPQQPGNPGQPGEREQPGQPPCVVCPKDPTQDVLLNPAVPPQVTGPGTTPPGGNPGETTNPGEQPEQPVENPGEPAPPVEEGANGGSSGGTSEGVVSGPAGGDTTTVTSSGSAEATTTGSA